VSRREFWIAYAAHRLLILVAACATAVGVGLAVGEATEASGDFTMASPPAWATGLVDPALATFGKVLYLTAVAALWVCLAVLGRILGRARAALGAAPAAVLPVPDHIRHGVFVDDPDFAALARGTTTTT
jgi:hypothetical protein